MLALEERLEQQLVERQAPSRLGVVALQPPEQHPAQALLVKSLSLSSRRKRSLCQLSL